MSNSSSSWGSSTKGSDAQPLETICRMLAMLSCSEKKDAQRNLLAMTNSPESCQSLRRAGCVPLLIQILHPGASTPAESQPSSETKARAAKALKNIVHFNPDDKLKRKELKVLKLLEHIRFFTIGLSQSGEHPKSSLQALMQLSFEESDKATICTLGGIQALADFLVFDNKLHGALPENPECIITRRYSCMTLTNLTYGDEVNKALLCSMTEFLSSLVTQLEIENDEIIRVTASVFRNLSWHTDSLSRKALSEAHVVTGLVNAAFKCSSNATLKATLYALWNLSAHSNDNKAEICATPNSLKFLVTLLHRHKHLTKENLHIVENAGGILRNVSNYAADIEEYRRILLENLLFEVLLEHLKMNSADTLAVVANACACLLNLSKHSEEQRKLLELNAVPLLKDLMYCKQPRISQGATATLQNILRYYEQSNDSRQQVDLENEQPLDLTIHSSKSSPMKKCNHPPFLNPPINYTGSVSATRSCPDIQLNKQEKMTDASTDETFNYSNYDEEEEEEKNPQKDTVKTYCDEGTPGFSGSMVDLSSQGVDSFLRFQVEDTPAVFSRTSSLSSIEENQHGETRAEKTSDAKKTGPLNIIVPTTDANTSSPSLPSDRVVPKRVMFSAEETPLMFSRCSSVASLESCGDLNNGRESDCVSEFSRRASEVVSPSELPDSPRGEAIRPVLTPPERSQANSSGHFVEDDSKRKPAPTATDELKVFAMEGTPFLISTATSLSDIVGELDCSMPEASATTSHPQPPPRPSSQPCSTKATEEKEMDPDVEIDDPIYTDVQLLQKCIKAGRAVGLNKKPAVEDEEVDLTHLIQRGRAKVLNRSEDNLQQCGLPFSMKNSKSSLPRLSFQKNSIGTLPLPNKNGCAGASFVNQNLKGYNANINQPIRGKLPSMTGSISDYAISAHNNMNHNTEDLQSIDVDNFNRKEDNVVPDTCAIQRSPNQNASVFYPVEGCNERSNHATNVYRSDENADNVSNHSQSDEVTTWTDETPSFSTSIPSMSMTHALHKVIAKEDEALSEVEPPTLNSFGTTMESVGCINLMDSHHKPMHLKQQQIVLPQPSSSQVSNIVNQKPPQEFFDMDNSMISVASIKSEIFDEFLQPVSSPVLPARNSQNNATGTRDSNKIDSVTTSETMQGATASSCSPNTNTITKSKVGSAQASPQSSMDQPKYDTFVIKRVESPKERRKNDPDRYITRTIEKFDLKMKPPVPPKPLSQASGIQAGIRSPSPASQGNVFAHTSAPMCRSTHTSELKTARTRDNSPTDSMTSFKTSPKIDGDASALTLTNTSNSSVGKIPPKPPVRSTPPLSNTTLPRNVKLMEGSNNGAFCNGSKNGNLNSNGATSGMVYTLENLQNHHQVPLQPISSKETSHKLNLGGRIGNLFRKSFTKSGAKKTEDSSHTSTSSGWTKRKEKVFIAPFSHKPPLDATNELEISNPQNLNGNNCITGLQNRSSAVSGIFQANVPAPSPSPPALPARNTAKSNENGSGGGTTVSNDNDAKAKASKITSV